MDQQESVSDRDIVWAFDRDNAIPSPPPQTLNDLNLIPGVIFEKFIDEGGFGQVYKARQAVLDRTVAVKLIPIDKIPSSLSDNDWVREAKALAKLNHPNIVRIYDGGIAGTNEDAYFYIILEFVESTGLAEMLKLEQKRTLSASRWVRFAYQIANAVAYAHSRGVIHRDLKPSNILVSPDGEAKVTDFGLARLLEPSQEVSIRAGMAPDSRVSAPPSYLKEAILSDVYALGRVLDAIQSKCLHAESKSLSIASVVERARDGDLGHRYRTATEVANALQRIVDRPKQHRRLLFAVIVASVLSILGWFLYHHDRFPDAEWVRARKALPEPIYTPGAHKIGPQPIITGVSPKEIPINATEFWLEIEGANFRHDVQYYVWAGCLILSDVTIDDNAPATFVSPTKLKVFAGTVTSNLTGQQAVALRWGEKQNQRLKPAWGHFRLVKAKQPPW